MIAIIGQTSLQSLNGTKKIRVACVGDSITELTIYPLELQTMLGDKYLVGNFGVTSSTVSHGTYTPYMDQLDFFEAKKFLPDIVVIMLGTNDARTDNFKSIENFVEDYTQIIEQLQELKTEPKIFVVKPPPIFENDLDLQSENLSEEIIPLIEGIANEHDLTLIDVYSVLLNYPEYFIDGVHPTDEGAVLIATEVYNAIMAFSEG